MPTPKTKAEIAAEIESLTKLKPSVRRHSMFNEDNWEKIDAMIVVLKEGLSTDAIYDRFGDPDDPDKIGGTLDSALTARHWLDGEHDEPTLAEGWPT